jgi:hypothetical protein
MRHFRRPLKALAAAFLAVVLVFTPLSPAMMTPLAPISPAHADLEADAQACIDLAKKAPNFAGDVSALLLNPLFSLCVGQATADPIMAAAIIAMSAIATTGKFKDPDSCNALIVAGIGSMILSKIDKALSSPGTAQDIGCKIIPCGALHSIIEKLKSAGIDVDDPFAAANEELGAAKKEALKELADLLTAALAPLNMYMACGCQVAGTGAAIVNMVEELGSDAKRCASLVSDVLNDPGEAGKEASKWLCKKLKGDDSTCDQIGAFFEDVGDFLADACTETGVCGALESGYDAAKELLGDAEAEAKEVYQAFKDAFSPHGAANPGTTECTVYQAATGQTLSSAPGYWDNGWKNYPGCGGYVCDIHDPSIKPQQLFSGGWKCAACPDGQGLQGGSCKKCESYKTTDSAHACYFTNVGMSAPDGKSCKYIPSQKTCCPTGQSTWSYGTCTPACGMGTGQYMDPTGGACKSCPDNWHPVFDGDPTKNSVGHCEECPSGTTSSILTNGQCQPRQCEPAGIPDPNDPHACIACGQFKVAVPGTGKCSCGEGNIDKGEGCECPRGATKFSYAGNFICKCPAGSELDPKTATCKCAAGQHIEGTAVSPGEYLTQCVANPDCGKTKYFDHETNKCESCPKGAKLTLTRDGGFCTCPSGTLPLNGVCTSTTVTKPKANDIGGIAKPGEFNPCGQGYTATRDGCEPIKVNQGRPTRDEFRTRDVTLPITKPKEKPGDAVQRAPSLDDIGGAPGIGSSAPGSLKQTPNYSVPNMSTSPGARGGR